MTGSRAIGVDVGGTKILAGAVDREGVVDRRESRPTPVSSQEAVLRELDEVVESLLGDDVAALGFGIPSTIDQRTGRAVSSVHIPLADLDFRHRMAERFGLPVGIDNDGNAAAIAEWRLGAARGASDVIALILGTGIGGGLILGGRPYRGSIGAGAELGHMVIDYRGAPCRGACTGHGHFEAFCAGSAADAAAKRYGHGEDARSLVAAAHAGDEQAVAGLAEMGHRLGAGIASLVNIFNPEVIVVGGGFAEAAGELIFGPARETLAIEGLRPGRDLVRIVPAELGKEAGMVGAALVGFEALESGR